MSINDFMEKIKPFYTLILLLVVASIFFALGRLSALNDRKQPIKIIQQNSQNSATVINAGRRDEVVTAGQLEANDGIPMPISSDSGQVIGSKSGKKYYFPWCGTIKRVKPENQVQFASIAEARRAGYLPAGNCKGLK